MTRQYIKRNINPLNPPGKPHKGEADPETLEDLAGARKPISDTVWSPEQWAFVVWSAIPAYERDPLTLEALAQKLGVSSRTLRNWRRIEGFYIEVRNLAKSYLEADLPDIYYALVMQAKTGSFPHIRLYLELIGEYVEKHDYTTGGQPFPVNTYDYSSALALLAPGDPAETHNGNGATHPIAT